MKIGADGQVMIPEEFRERFGLTPGTEVRLELEGNAIRIRRVEPPASPAPSSAPPLSPEPSPGKGAALVAFTRGKATTDLTTEEIMHLMRGEN